MALYHDPTTHSPPSQGMMEAVSFGGYCKWLDFDPIDETTVMRLGKLVLV